MKFFSQFLRLCILASSFTLFAVGALIISFLIFPVASFFVKKENLREFYSTVIHNSWSIFTGYMSVLRLIEVRAEGKIKNIRGKVIVSNHPTLIDIVILIGLIPTSVCLAKSKLKRNFFTKNIVKAICISNDTSLEEFKEQTDEFLKNGYNIILFPAGTRNKDGEDVKIHKGAAFMAMNSDTTIVPLKINCSEKFLQSEHPWYETPHNRVVYDIKVLREINPKNFDEKSEIILRKLISEKIKESIS